MCSGAASLWSGRSSLLSSRGPQPLRPLGTQGQEIPGGQGFHGVRGKCPAFLGSWTMPGWGLHLPACIPRERGAKSRPPSPAPPSSLAQHLLRSPWETQVPPVVCLQVTWRLRPFPTLPAPFSPTAGEAFLTPDFSPL